MNKILEDFSSAMHQFQQNKGRTVLSLLGIMIGILCVITISTLSHSLKVSVKKSFTSINNRIIQVQSMFRSHDETSFKLDDSYKNQLLSNVENIEQILLTQRLYANVITSSTKFEWRDQEILAVDYGWFKNTGFNFINGNDFSLNIYAEGLHSIILGEEIAKYLFPDENPIGKKVWMYIYNPYPSEPQKPQMLPKAFEVAGVVNSGNLITSSVYMLIIPRSVLTREGLAGTDPMTSMDIIASDEQHVSQVKTNVIDFTDNLTGVSESIRATSFEEQMKNNFQGINSITLVLNAIGALSLLVGGIGIMNIMIVTVTERRQEIGIRKALGASKKNILTQFLIESISITVVGACIGTLLGCLISYALFQLLNFQSNITTMTFAVDPLSICFAIGISIILGVFFGLYPALQAAKLHPVLALEEV